MLFGRVLGRIRNWSTATRMTTSLSSGNSNPCIFDSKCSMPPLSFVKCNSDAALFSQIRRVGSGLVIHDELGHFLGGRRSLH